MTEKEEDVCLPITRCCFHLQVLPPHGRGICAVLCEHPSPPFCTVLFLTQIKMLQFPLFHMD